jgi:Lon protease-like protein
MSEDQEANDQLPPIGNGVGSQERSLVVVAAAEEQAEENEADSIGGSESDEEDFLLVDTSDEDQSLDEEEQAIWDASNLERDLTTQDLPAPREHSYLVGASHPLVAEGSLRKHPRQKIDSKSPFIDLAILELHGVVLFPESTIPIKIRDRALIRHLGRQIDRCRRSPDVQSVVRLGILTYEAPPIRRRAATRRSVRDQRQRGSWMRTGIAGGQAQRISLVLLDEFPLEDVNDAPEQQNKHPFIGRVGTIATIKYTHEESDDRISGDSISSSQVWRRHEEGSELVVTAVGTSRFQVVSCDQDEISGGLRTFQVDEWVDQPLSLPPIGRPMASAPSEREESTVHSHQLVHQDRIVWNLSMITPVPYFVYQRVWPWTLMRKLIDTLETHEGKANLPSLGEIDESMLEPTKFSFWMASNMPLTEEARLSILKMFSTVERLRVLHDKVLEFAQRECYVYCKACDMRFTSLTSVFVVGGAEGTTSNYGTFHEKSILLFIRVIRLCHPHLRLLCFLLL